MEGKTEKHFKEKIQIEKGKTRRRNLVHSNNTTVEEALRKENQLKTKLNNKMREVVLALRCKAQPIINRYNFG